MRIKECIQRHSNQMYIQKTFLTALFFVNLIILQPAVANAQIATIVYPGWDDDGKRLVKDAIILNSDAQAIIVITKDYINVYKNQWQEGAKPDYFFKSQSEAKSILSYLKDQGIQNVIINIDMDIGLKNYIPKGAKEIEWATSKGIQWSQAFRAIFNESIIGSLSHSFGNAPAGNVVEKSKIDYAVMASPQAKRDSLNKISEKTKLLILSATGDIGPVTWDGPTKFDYVILNKTPDPHNSMIEWNNLNNSSFFKEKVKSMKTNIKVDWDNPNSPTLGELWRKFYAVPSYWINKDYNYPTGKFMTESQTLTETVHNKNKAIIVGKGAEVDLMYKNMVQKLGESNVKRIDSYFDGINLQLEARKFGADVILGVKDPKLSETTGHSSDRFPGQKTGGVLMALQPEAVGKGGSEVRDEVLRSKPSGDSLSWPIPIKEK